MHPGELFKYLCCYCCSVTNWCPVLCDPWAAVHQASLSFSMSKSLLKFISIELVMLSNHLFLCHPPLFLSSTFPSIRIFFNKSALYVRWLKYWRFSIRCPASNLAEGQAGAGNCEWKPDSHSWRLPLKWCLCVCAQSLCCSLQVHRL